MAEQFDLYRTQTGSMVVVLQADGGAAPATRIVAPLAPQGAFRTNHAYLAPEITLGEGMFVVLLPQLATLTRAELGDRIGSVAHLRDAIVRGLDLLFTGA